MSDEELQAIQERAKSAGDGYVRASTGTVAWREWLDHVAEDEQALIAEVERLRNSRMNTGPGLLLSEWRALLELCQFNLAIEREWVDE